MTDPEAAPRTDPASTLSERAAAGQVLVSGEVVSAVDGGAGITFDGVGPVELKGFLEPLSLYTARRAG